MSAPSFGDYDRITDTLMYFNNELTLKFVCVMAKYNNGARRFFSYEVPKQSKYPGQEAAYNINRTLSFYFVIDNKNEFGSGFIIRPGDAYMLLELINVKILPWFHADSPEYAYQIMKDKLLLTEFKPAIYTQSDIKYLKFEPVVITDMDDRYTFGININISGLTSIDITLEKFLEFVRYLQSDMYGIACSMINYAKTAPYGVNMIGARRGLASGGPVDNGWNNDTLYSIPEDDVEVLPQSESNDGKRHNAFLDSLNSKKRR